MRKEMADVLTAIISCLVMIILGAVFYFIPAAQTKLGAQGAQIIGGTLVFLGVFALFVKLMGVKNKWADIIVGAMDNLVAIFFGGMIIFNPTIFAPKIPEVVHYIIGGLAVVASLALLVFEIINGMKRRG